MAGGQKRRKGEKGDGDEAQMGEFCEEYAFISSGEVRKSVHIALRS